MKQVHTLQYGGLVALPTETVWGLCCDPFNARAVERFYTVKERDNSKPSQMLCATVKHARDLCNLAEYGREFEVLAQFFPYITLVMPAKLPNHTVGVRVTQHPVAQAFIAACGGVVLASSLNSAGKPPAQSYSEAVTWKFLYDDIVPGETSLGQASSVYHIPERRLIREGVISLQRIQEALGA